MANSQQNEKFGKQILVQWPLDEALEWIRSHLEPEDVFELQTLRAWAEDNNYELRLGP